ncbi:VOC family protein [Myxococcota bacterium]|nr:VOC family protein [Myxococcota bacterium]
MIQGIHHTAISTGDLDRSLRFYRDVLGFELMMDHRWEQGTDNMDRTMNLRDTSARCVLLRTTNAMIEIFEYESPRPAPGDPARPLCDHGITHLCLEVDDIDAEYDRLVKAGMHFHSPPVQNDGARMTYGRDPDGNAIELIEFQRDEEPLALRTTHGGGTP